MPIQSIVITHNPVTVEESFHLELTRPKFELLQLITRDIGWYFSAKFRVINPTVSEALQWLNGAPGREVRFYNERSNVDWEGFINSVKLSDGRGEAVNSLNDMGNKVWVRYKDEGTGNNVRSTVFEHAASQARFGIKEMIITGGELTADNANRMAEATLDLKFWAIPQLSRIDLGAVVSRQDLQIEVSCLGWWHTLKWRSYNQTAAGGTAQASAVITAIEAAVGQFIASTSIDTNDMLVPQDFDADRWAADCMTGVAGVGDGNNNIWIVGVDAGRDLYFRQGAPPRVEGTVL